jgi:hemoglobin
LVRTGRGERADIGAGEDNTAAGRCGSQDISTPLDVHALLASFYEVALADELLGPVFRTAGMRLETHLPRIVAFWEVTLLGTNTYTGSPLTLHRRAAAASGLGEEHFARWLTLWERAVASLFVGPTADRAVDEAKRMAVGMLRDLHRHPAKLPSDRVSDSLPLRGKAGRD